jgi:hypothetical protein
MLAQRETVRFCISKVGRLSKLSGHVPVGAVRLRPKVLSAPFRAAIVSNRGLVNRPARSTQGYDAGKD